MTLHLPTSTSTANSTVTSTAQSRPTASRARLGLIHSLIACIAMAFLVAAPLHAAARGAAKAYVIGQLSGPLAAGLELHLDDLELPEAPLAEEADGTPAATDDVLEINAPLVVAGSSVSTLGDDSRSVLRQAFAEGWPIAIVDSSAEQINQLHEIAGSGQVYEVAAGGSAPEAFAFVRRADGGYAQRSADAVGNDTFQASLREERALGLIQWLTDSRAGASPAAAKTTSRATASPKADSTEPAELDQLVSAWTDTRTFYYSSGSAQSTFQCVQEVWQAYQVSTQNDFYYLDQICNFSPANTYVVRGKKLETPTIFSNEDWDEVNWSNTDDYCIPSSNSGKPWTACDYNKYATQYHINLQPFAADGTSTIPSSLLTLIQENPQTTSENSTATHGVTWSIGGQVVAGSAGASASVSAGVQVENSTTTTIPAYTIQNQSLTGTQNAEWNYNLAAVTYIDDVCTNTMNEPQDIQIQTFETEQDLIWQVQPGYRTSAGFDGTFKVQLNFSAQLTESTMYVDEKGSTGVTNLSDCNVAGCSCEIVQSSTTPSLGAVILSIPVPSTDYTG